MRLKLERRPCFVKLINFYARLVIIYIAIFCIFASKFAEKAFAYRKKNN